MTASIKLTGRVNPTYGGLTALLLESNAVGPAGAAALAEGLLSNCHLTLLNLDFNRLRAEGAAAIAGALRTNDVLTHLYLALNDGDVLKDEL